MQLVDPHAIIRKLGEALEVDPLRAGRVTATSSVLMLHHRYMAWCLTYAPEWTTICRNSPDLERREEDLRALRIARAEAGMTAGELAARSGVGRNTISRIERGLVEPQAATLHKLAEALGISVAALVGGGWRQAIDDSLRFRVRAKERLREQLSLWEAARDE